MALDENSAVKSAKRLVMSTINKYVKTSKISEAKFREIVKYFAFDLDAQTIALLTKLNRNTVNRYLSLIRQRIADMCEEASPFQGEIEVDESYCGAKRIKGKRGRGAGKTLQAIIKLIHSDSWRGYNGLVDVGYKKHYR